MVENIRKIKGGHKLVQKNKFIMASSSDWTEAPSNQEIIDLVSDYSISEDKSEDGRKIKICFLNKRILRVADDKNEDYNLFVYKLELSEDLQSAVTQDFILGEYNTIIFHRIDVIRDGLFIDKMPDTTFRVFDNEPSSSSGSIHNGKKVHIIINDLHLGDVFIVEYSIVFNISEDNFLDKKYCRYSHFLPKNNWLYKKYIFKLINSRENKICVKKRYFRNEKSEIINEQTIVNKGESYVYEKSNFNEDFGNDFFTPFFEISTVANWEEIIDDHLLVYQKNFIKDDAQYLDELFYNITRGTEEIDEKIKKVIEYVQDRIVYIFDADVMHNYIPQSTKKTIDKHSGDCKAKAYLLSQLFSKLGIEANLALVNYDLGFYIANEMPSTFIFSHVIVKVYYKNKVYFIDPTWSGKCGFIEYRTQPIFAYYLEIKKHTTLQQASHEETVSNCLEEKVTINVKRKRGKIEAETTYRFTSADNLRRFLRENVMSRVIQMETEYHFKRLNYQSDQNFNDYISDADYKIIYDNDKTNEIKVLYTATLLDPYKAGKNIKVVRYYYDINSANIENITNKDAIIDNLFEIGRQVHITIKSDKFYDFQNQNTIRSLKIDNAYFFFSNKKKLSLKTVKVFSEFRPKGYKAIARVDIEKIKKDCQKINSSNFGVGIVYQNRFITIVTIILAYIFLAYLIDHWGK